MPAYPYKKLDAFTSGRSLGNPAACLYLAPGQALSDADMLAVAQQHKGFVSEVIYCTSGADQIELIYYSSECEVDFCGHGTIACLYSLIKDSPQLLARDEITIHTRRKGPLTVYNRLSSRDAVFITAPEPVYIGTGLDRTEIAAQLGVDASCVSADRPVDVIDAGLRTLIVPLCGLDTEISVFPDEATLKAFCLSNDIDIILVYSMDTQDEHCHAHTRVFAPRFGYLEDPATGSGNSAFGYYMLKNGLWDGRDCRIEQGGSDRIFNVVQLSCAGRKVLFGGGATLCIDGLYHM